MEKLSDRVVGLTSSTDFGLKFALTLLRQLNCPGGISCNKYGPRSDCSLRSSLIRVHSVCLYDIFSL